VSATKPAPPIDLAGRLALPPIEDTVALATWTAACWTNLIVVDPTGMDLG